MEVSQETQQIEITLHVYIDDLQEVIQKSGSPELFLATDHEIEQADDFIADYIAKHLVIKNGGKSIPFTWLGKEQSDDLLAFWCFLETDAVDENTDLQITYSVLQDLYDDQQNILNVIKSDGAEAYFLCRKGEPTATIE